VDSISRAKPTHPNFFPQIVTLWAARFVLRGGRPFFSGTPTEPTLLRRYAASYSDLRTSDGEDPAIAAGALYPLLGWTLSPMLAGVTMSISSISVVTNALRLRHLRL
jgi:hypothetical protein